MKITVLASIISALCLSRMVHAGGTWSWLYTTADSDPNKCGHIQQPTAPEEVSPRYDINHDKCLYGEPNRTHFWAPSKISFPELYPDFCLHMSKKDFCQCQDNAVIFQTKGGCVDIPIDEGPFQSYWFTRGECGDNFCWKDERTGPAPSVDLPKGDSGVPA